ncbi:hypothetical protein NG55_05585 [Acinetobacter gyllenbergii]|nr:restriction endonuclease subunit S [Acinetobacter gyllenbergii]OBY76130.1 hypothetical protein NG55_05585 [Acinetobacter gyllenbergii]
MTVPKLRFKEFDGDWLSSNLGEISDIKTGPFGSTLHQEDYVDIGTPIITVEHLGEIGITNQNLPLVSDADKTRLKSYLLKVGDLAFSRVGSVDRCAIVTEKENGWLFSGRILRVRPNNELIDSKNLMYALKTEDAQYRIRSVAVGQTMPSLNTEILKNFPVILSNSKKEQTKIAFFLSAVDEKISQLNQKHELLSQYKQGMMQKLFSQKIRFKADDGSDFREWEKTLLSEFLTESLIKGLKGNEAKKLTVKLWGKGIVPKNEVFEGSENTQYYKRFVGQLIYGKLDFLNCAFGIIPSHLDGYETTIDAPSFDINTEKANAYFLLNRFLQKDFYKKNGEEADGSRKAKRINQSVFLAMQIDLPCLEEQTKIANFLSAIDQKIEVVVQQIEQAKQWKKGLLQQMFV